MFCDFRMSNNKRFNKMFKKLLLLILLVYFSCQVVGQTVNIYVWTGSLTPANMTARYETAYGAGNVILTQGTDESQFVNHDIVILNQILNTNYPNTLVNSLVTYVQGGGHVVLSSEGCQLADGTQLMSAVWNTLTGDAITETGAGASGTNAPPRFHNSNGPWGLSPDPTITPSTTSYASFGNVPALSVTHQRDATPPSCNNIEGICAVYPSKPSIGQGTLYIQGEIQFPFLNQGQNVQNHGNALALMHYTLLTGDQATLNTLNSWGNNPIGGDLLNDTTFCKGSLSPFTLNSPPAASYSWEDRAGTVLSTAQSFTITDTGKYFLYTVGNPGECDGNDSIHVTYDSLSFDTLTVPTCSNLSNGSIEVTAVNGQSVTNPISYQLDNNPATNNPIFNNLASGSYQVKVTDARGCKDSLIVPVGTLAAPVANFETDTACIGNVTSYTDLSTSGSAIAQWEWRIEGTTANTQNTTYTYNSQGPFSSELKITATNGCFDSITKTVETSANPFVDFSSVSACANTPVVFTNNTMANGKVYNNNFIFSWDFDDGNSSTAANPSNTYTTEGTYDVQLTAVTDKGCIHDTTIPVTVFELPVADFAWGAVCANQPMVLTDQSTVTNGTINNWNWTIDGAVYSGANQNYVYPTGGTDNVSLTVTTVDGCSDNVIIPVTVYALPTARFSTDVSVVKTSNSTVNFINESSGAASYFWLFNNEDVATAENPSYTYRDLSSCGTITNSLRVVSVDGCIDSTSSTLETLGELAFFVPTAFSPDGDGVNDVFMPTYTDLDDIGYSFTIFDRWGTIVFETDQITNSWDGTKNNKLLDQGVYVYRIQTKTFCSTEEQLFKGHVTLIK